MPVQADKTTQSNVDIAVKLATTKKSVERRSVSRFPQAGNTPITTNSDYDDHCGMFVMSVEYECIMDVFTPSLGQSRFSLFCK